ncbi:MAG TPA: ABC transporter permease [Actinomycetota bacterium]|nr:ABC transporter permease [Actinomycetota bacterium]
MKPSRWDPVWTKAPVVLFRYPGLLAALAVGALLLSLTAAAYPLFLSGSAARLLRGEIAESLVGPYGIGLTYRTRTVPIHEPAPEGGGLLYEARGRTFAELAGESPYLARTEQTMLGPSVSLNDPEHPRRVRSGRLFAGREALHHVEILEGTDGPGVWIPDVVARGLRLGAGDRIRLSYADREPVIMPVDGVYGTLASRPPGGYWLAWETEIYPSSPSGCRGDCPIPSQFILADTDQVLDLAASDRLGEGTVTFGWQAPLRRDIPFTLDDARSQGEFTAAFRRQISHRSTRAGRILDCCHRASLFPFEPGTEFASDIASVVEQVEAQITSLEGPGSVLRVAGLLVALAVLASAGAFSAGARSTEVRLLEARGTGPAGAGAKAVVEAVIPSIAGGVVGLGLAFVFVRLVSGSPAAGSAIRAAVVAAAISVTVAVVALGLVAALVSVRHSGHHQGRLSALARVPWELAILGFALFAAQRLPSGLGSTEVLHESQPPSPFLLLFPIAFVAGFSGLGARLLREGFRRLRDRGAARRKASYLAVHRLAGAPLLSVLLVAAAGLCLGVFVHGQSLVRSLEFTVDAKAKVFVGSDVQAWIAPESGAPPDFPMPVTQVGRARQAGEAVPGGGAFDLLGVDPSTLARAAFWADGFADLSLEELARRLRPPADGPVPVIVAGAEGFEPTGLEMNRQLLPVQVVAHTDAFPGMLSRRPLVVIDAGAVAGAYQGTTNPLVTETATTELWVRGDPGRATVALRDPRITTYQVITANEVKDLPRVATVIDTFAVLDALALATGVLVIAALLMYLQARQRSQIVAYGLSIRMGMGPGSHRRSLALEVGSMLGGAFVLGVGLGLAASVLLVGRLDPLPVVPPDPLLVWPVPAIVAALGGAASATWLAAWITSRRAAAVRLGEAMRVAE